MTREERKRARRIAIVSWLLSAAWIAVLLCTCASAAYEGAEEPDKLTEVLALIGAGTVSAGVMRCISWLDTPTKGVRK